MIHVALFQPDIPQNTGAIARLCACLGIPLHIIEPCGFIFDDRRFRRAGMDYVDHLQLHRHADWSAFMAAPDMGRKILLSTGATVSYLAFEFLPNDVLILGRESAGVPKDVHRAAHAEVRIPMIPAARSLNVALSAAMVTGEALRRTGHFAQLV